MSGTLIRQITLIALHFQACCSATTLLAGSGTCFGADDKVAPSSVMINSTPYSDSLSGPQHIEQLLSQNQQLLNQNQQLLVMFGTQLEDNKKQNEQNRQETNEIKTMLDGNRGARAFVASLVQDTLWEWAKALLGMVGFGLCVSWFKVYLPGLLCRAHCIMARGSYTPPEAPKAKTQEEMLEHFKQTIIDGMKVYEKVTDGFAMKATPGQWVPTIVLGKHIAQPKQVPQDGDWWVVKDCTPNGETRLMKEAVFKTSYDIHSAQDLSMSSPEECDLSREGYRRYKSTRQVWTYKLTRADKEWIHEGGTGEFITAWGSKSRTVLEGDMLAMGFPESNATDVYLMPVASRDTMFQELDVLTQAAMVTKFNDMDASKKQRWKWSPAARVQARDATEGEEIVTYVGASTHWVKKQVTNNHSMVQWWNPSTAESPGTPQSSIVDKLFFQSEWEEVPEHCEVQEMRDKGFRNFRKKSQDGKAIEAHLVEQDECDTRGRWGWFKTSQGNPVQLRQGNWLVKEGGDVRMVTECERQHFLRLDVN